MVKEKKRSYLSQSDVPRFTLEKSLVIAQTLWDEFAGKSAEPHQIAIANEYSPASGNWRNLCGSSIAYGLTEGGYNAKEIILSPIGRAIVAPNYEGEDIEAMCEAVLKPTLLKSFFEKYDRAKLPSPNIAQNVLVSMGVPKERAEEVFQIIHENGSKVGIIQDTKTGPFVSINSFKSAQPKEKIPKEQIPKKIEDQEEIPRDTEEFARQLSGTPETQDSKNEKDQVIKNNKVFISHGKNKQVVEQLKEIIKFGKYEPVVSVENETLSKPVPEKVLDDMRSCTAGIINVHSEGELLDQEGNTHIKINDNVLIEIGAAMALYGRNYVLLVQKGVKLPSNLQGLYRCEYEGEKLDYDATMKILKTFNQFT